MSGHVLSAESQFAADYWWAGAGKNARLDAETGDFQWRMRRLQEALIRIHLPRMAATDAARAQRTLDWLKEAAA
jgi:hypothetical protein